MICAVINKEVSLVNGLGPFCLKAVMTGNHVVNEVINLT